MPLRIINDTHMGVNRNAGTTLASKAALKASMLVKFNNLLPESDLMILGDLFDSYEVYVKDLLDVYSSLKLWLAKGHRLYLVAGNHDESKTSTTISSFDFLCALLSEQFPDTVVVITEPCLTMYGYVIPHLPNQTLFDAAMLEVPKCDFLFLHCNYDNHFATQSDHSLNLTKEQADSCKAETIIIAHEHPMRQVGKVILPGNQICTSIADWVGCNAKFFCEVTRPVVQEGTLLVPAAYTLAQFADAELEYAEIDWKQLEVTVQPFIRAIGTAKVAEASQLANILAKFRQKSPAFVIGNAVKIELDEAMGGFAEALEAAQGFDVWDALATTLPADDMVILKGLE